MCGVTQASVLFSDSFDSVSSGTGFSGAWEAGGTYAGGEVAVLDSNGTLFRSISTGINTATMDFWLAIDLTAGLDTGGTPTTAWAAISLYDAGNEDFAVGSDTASEDWEFDTDGITDVTSTVDIFTGNPAQVILHITSTSIDMWVDPADTSNIAALGAADASTVVAAITPNGTWDSLRLGKHNNATLSVDNIVAATTFAEVVPEPGSLALLGLGGLALLRRRRA